MKLYALRHKHSVSCSCIPAPGLPASTDGPCAVKHCSSSCISVQAAGCCRTATSSCIYASTNNLSGWLQSSWCTWQKSGELHTSSTSHCTPGGKVASAAGHLICQAMMRPDKVQDFMQTACCTAAENPNPLLPALHVACGRDICHC